MTIRTVGRLRDGVSITSSKTPLITGPRMRLSGKHVLPVGQSFRSADALTDRLQRRGFRSRVTSSVRSASDLIRSSPVDLLLSKTHLPDGTGFGLLGTLVGFRFTAFLCLPLQDGCFWLPAIDAGKQCLGLPALRPREFASTLEKMARSLAAAPRSTRVPMPDAHNSQKERQSQPTGNVDSVVGV